MRAYMLVFAAAVSLALILSSSIVHSQGTQLGSGSTDFEVRPIQLLPPAFQDGDYCGNPKNPPSLNPNMALQSNPGFLNVRWNARDPGGIERTIGVDCWLNCPASALSLLSDPSVCAGYQTCSFVGPTGDRACSIQQPSYVSSADNNVSCRFYDPILPSYGLVVEQRTFKTIDYEVYTPPVTVTVGSPATTPIDVKSFGILDSYFFNNMSALQTPELVYLKNGYALTSTLKCGEVGRTFPSVTMLAATKVPFTILVKSSIDGTVCSTDSDCNYLDSPPNEARCVQGACWKRLDIDIDANIASLPEYPIHGFLLIVAASTAAVLLARRKM